MSIGCKSELYTKTPVMIGIILNTISYILEIKQFYLLLCKNQLKKISDNPNVMVKETVRDTMKGVKT